MFESSGFLKFCTRVMDTTIPETTGTLLSPETQSCGQTLRLWGMERYVPVESVGLR